MEKQARQVVLENLPRSLKLDIPIPEGGGVVVLQGRNGTGKTLALEAVEALITGDGQVAVAEGYPTARVAGLGASLTVGRRKTRSGELEISHLAGTDLSILVDPGLRDPMAADARRIKAILSLCGSSEDRPTLVGRILEGVEGGPGLISAAAMATSDLVEFGAKAKREIETAARAQEEKAAALASKAEGLDRAAQGFDPEAAMDQGPLRLAVQEIGKEALACAVAASTAAALREKIAATAADDPAKAIQELATMDLDEIQLQAQHGLARAAELEHKRQAEAAMEKLRDIRARRGPLQRLLEAQEGLARHREELGKVEGKASQLPEIEARRAQLQEALENATNHVRLAALVSEASKLRTDAGLVLAQGDSLRGAAARIDPLLSELIGEHSRKLGLSIDGGVLYVSGVERAGERCPFRELSHGERWLVAINLASVICPGGLFVCRQEAWEALDPQNRLEVSRIAAACRVVILTAEATEDAQIVARLAESGLLAQAGLLPTLDERIRGEATIDQLTGFPVEHLSPESAG